MERNESTLYQMAGGRTAYAAAARVGTTGPLALFTFVAVDRTRWGQRVGAVEHPRPAYAVDLVAGAAAFHDPVCAAAGGVPLPAAGAGDAIDAHQPDADWAVAGADLLPDAAGGAGHSRHGDRALRRRKDGRGYRHRARNGAAAPLHAQVRPPKRSGAVSRTGQGAAAGQTATTLPCGWWCRRTFSRS